MDVIKYLKARRRMLGEFCYKNNCGACKLFACCDCETDEQIEQDVKIVEQWALDNPIKTYKSEFLKMFPNAILDSDGYPQTSLYYLTGKTVIPAPSGCWDAEFKGWS